MTTKTKILLGVVGGVALGVGIGLLLAPEKGTDLRRKLGDTAGGWADQLSDIFANARGEMQNLKGKGSRAASDLANKFSRTKESYS
jgi:gas vesicle protein